MSKNKELQTQEQSKEIAQLNDLSAFGATQDMVSAKDLVIPKILLMQANSTLVVEEEVAKAGDAVNSVTKEVLANLKDGSIELIPFYLDKVFSIQENKEDGEWIRYEQVTAANEKLPYEDVEDGVAIKRPLHRNFYCIIPGQTDLPVILPLKGLGAKAGKQLATMMYVQNIAAGKQPPAYHINVTCRKEKTDKGTFNVFQISKGSETTQEEMLECLKWYKAVSSGKAKAHEVEQTSVSSEF